MLGLLSFVPLKGWLALGLAGVLAGALWYHQHEIGERDDLIAERDKTIATRDITIANQALSISAERLSVTKLQAAVDVSNHTIEEQALRLKAVQLTASAAASQAFTKGMAAAEALRAPTSTVQPGHAAMNDWFAERFGQ